MLLALLLLLLPLVGTASAVTTPSASYSLPGETFIAVFAGLHEPASADSKQQQHLLHNTLEGAAAGQGSVSSAGETAPTAAGELVTPGDPGSSADGTVPSEESGSSASGPVPPRPECGAVSWRGVQQAMAAEWAIQAINNQTDPRHRIGVRILDTCSTPAVAVQQLLQLLQDSRQPAVSPLLGVVSVGGAAETEALAPLLSAHSVALLVTSAEAAYDVTPSPNLFAATPHLQTQMQSVVMVVGELLMQGGAKRGDHILMSGDVGMIWSSQREAAALRGQATKAGLVINLQMQLRATTGLQDQLLHFATSNRLGRGTVVVLLLTVQQIQQLGRSAGQQRALKRLGLRWVLSSIQDDPLSHQLDILKVNEALPGVVVVGPHNPHLGALQKRLAAEVCSQHTGPRQDDDTAHTSKGGGSILAPLLHQYCHLLHMQTISSPAWPNVNNNNNDSSNKSVSISSSLLAVDASHTASILRAVSTLAAAFRLVQIESCADTAGCVDALRPQLAESMLSGLQKLSYGAREGVDRLRYTADARLHTSFSVVTSVRGDLLQVGQYREGSGMEWQVETIPPVPSPFLLSKPLVGTKVMTRPVDDRQPVPPQPAPPQTEEWRSTVWSVLVCIVTAIGLVLCCCTATYLAIQGCDGALRGTEAWLVLVLIGTCGGLCAAVVLVLPVPLPDVATLCCLQHVLPLVALGLAYAAMLTKALHTRLQHALNAHYSKIPGAVLYLPLAALLALAVLLAALTDQTTLHLILPNEVTTTHVATIDNPQPAQLVSTRYSTAEHNTPPSQQQQQYEEYDEGSQTFTSIQLCTRLDTIPAILGFVYLVVLLVASLLMLATTKSNKKETHDFYECRRVMAVCGVSVPLVMLWAAVTLYSPPQLQPLLAAFLLQLLSYALLLLLLLPMVRHMAARNTKQQFSHKPLDGPGSIATVFSSSNSSSSGTPHPVVSYSSRGEEGGCRFSDVIMSTDMMDAYKLKDGGQYCRPQSQRSPYRPPNLRNPYLLPQQHDLYRPQASRDKLSPAHRPYQLDMLRVPSAGSSSH